MSSRYKLARVNRPSLTKVRGKYGLWKSTHRSQSCLRHR
eukprot:CAMPEP_0172401900 /NCGR_PEP_ID=MMETSP1061-20121228/52479_1 /TAXON_ID=37318 /ORGANISM="Pseudo-nitzschia pungens, Strain cf. pungens" /LENGTH=38 /DNA_ID= /DNA_START= /DNA_END= /DNA_ORIENTATION=